MRLLGSVTELVEVAETNAINHTTKGSTQQFLAMSLGD